MAPSDKYDNRTIEVIQDAIIDDSESAWEQRALHEWKKRCYNHLCDVKVDTTLQRRKLKNWSAKNTENTCVGAYARNEKIVYAIRIFLRFVRMTRIYALMHVRFESVLTLCL